MKRYEASLPPQRLPVAILLPFCSIYSALCSAAPAIAQIVPAADGTGTVVMSEAASNESHTRFNIEQGSLSADERTQFHSFESFSLQAGETANFIAPESVRNILTRVSGGDRSIINGQLQIADPAQANLFLLNPAGVLFGPEATVNLPANLTVTTADAIQFEQGSFSSTQANTYTAISGSPTGEFVFSEGALETAGHLQNEGNLTLSPNASLSLIGRTVENSGTLAAPEGQIVLAAIPEAGTVRISQHNQLLSLEIDATTPAWNKQSALQQRSSTLNPLSIPALLTSPSPDAAARLSVTSNGTAQLTADPLPKGSTQVSGRLSTSTNAADSLGGEINILGRQISLTDATLSANSPSAGGTIRIGGDYQGQGPLFTADQTLIDSSTEISADATAAGNGGRIIVWANDTTQYLGDISAAGGNMAGDGGFIEVSGKKNLNFQGTADTRAPYGNIGSLLLDPENITIVNGFTATDDSQLNDGAVFATEGTEFTLAERTLANLSGSTAVTLEATNNITVQPLLDKTLAFRPGTAPVTFRADADGDGTGDFTIPFDHTIIAPGRSLSISGVDLNLGELNTAAAIQGGDITLTASGNITTGNINSFAVSPAPAVSPKGGDVTVIANGDIVADTVKTENAVQPGNVTLASQTGSIAIAAVPDPASGSMVTIEAPRNISVAGNDIQTAPTIPALTTPTETPVDLPTTASAAAPPANTLPTKISNGARSIANISYLNLSTTTNTEADDAKNASNQVVQRTELTDSAANAILTETETQQTTAFGIYFQRAFETADVDITKIKQLLTDIESETDNRSAVIYVKTPSTETLEQREEQLRKAQLEQSEILLEAPSPPLPGSFELMLITADGKPIKITIPDLERAQLLQTVNRFRSDLLTSVRRGGEPYLSSAEQLYDWLIEPLESDLEIADIDTLIFKLDEGLRTLPLAALYDEEQFLVEKYSLGVIPSIGLAEMQYDSLDNADVLAMGASEFEQLEPLPAVAQELKEISDRWPARTFINETFTRQNLIQQQAKTPANIIHLATHAEFNAGTSENSYIQLWDDKLHLNELAQMGWNAQDLGLLVLSACSTAMGNPEAELGFAGLALASGAQSVLASLWSVDDIGTLNLMSYFYQQLKDSPTKAEALQATQLSMLNNTLENADSTISTELGTLPVRDFSHPYYWSSFTLIGSPW